MSQFSSSFWDVYIAVITLVSVVACGVFLKMQSVRKVAGGATETTGHTWDEDLGEFNNPLPRWWMWLFYLTIVFAWSTSRCTRAWAAGRGCSAGARSGS